MSRLCRVLILAIAVGLCARQQATASVYISEFVASNSNGLQDETGDRPDWIEVHNDGTEAVNLRGWGLFDGSADEKPWIFPDYTLEPDAYIVVFASGDDRRESLPFHTNFELKRSGEALTLITPDRSPIASPPLPAPYPEQQTDVAFGRTDDGYRYLSTPTPGKTNLSSRAYSGILSSPKISHDPGWFDAPFSISINNLPSDARAFYTLDGSEPTATTGIRLSAPLTISGTTILRITLEQEGYLSPEVSTFTFLNESDVISQSRPADYPEYWADEIPADYSMDPTLTQHSDYRALMLPALKSLPVISLVTDASNLFDADSGIYMHPEEAGVNWERSVSAELIGFDSSPSLQINAAIRIQGRSSRQPRTSPKHSFRLLFKHPYGPTTLQHPLFDGDPRDAEYNTLVLRATSNYSWTYPLAEQRERAQYLRDAWVKETQRAMGHVVPKTKFAHLFLNGLYWGLYNITERPDDAFMAQHFGNKKSKYDVIKGGEVVAGTDRVWRRIFAIAGQGLEDPDRYRALIQYLDPDSFIDFIILNHFIGNQTWDFGNWYAARLDHEDGRFKFFCWDAETTMNRVYENRVMTRNAFRPTALFHALRKNEEFRKRFGERLRKHCTGNGTLTPNQNIERYRSLAQKIDLAIVSESARWGDYRMTRHPYRTPPFERYTRDEHWYSEQNRLLTEYFPNRTEILLNQYRSLRLFR